LDLNNNLIFKKIDLYLSENRDLKIYFADQVLGELCGLPKRLPRCGFAKDCELDSKLSISEKDKRDKSNGKLIESSRAARQA